MSTESKTEDAQPDQNRRPLERYDLQRMNIPPLYWKSKAKHVQASVHQQVKNYLRSIEVMVDKSAGLLISGASGVGKTSIAALILMEARSSGFTGYFTTIDELREAIRNKTTFDGDQLIADRCRSVDVLVIDDLVESDTDAYGFNTKSVLDLVNYRGCRKRLTVLTTRLGKEWAKEAHREAAGHLVYFPVTGIDLWQQRQVHLTSLIFDTED